MIWLVGCNGMLGTELSHLFKKSGLTFVGTDREVDFTSLTELNRFVGTTFKPGELTHIINCAAYTAVDKAEDEIEACANINREGPKNLALIARATGAVLIHISTDYVFDGEGIVVNGVRRPYTELDKLGPTGVYGRTKAEAEQEIAKATSNFYIIRTAWLYGAYGNNFVFTMLKLMKERESLGVINDQYGSPTWAFDLSNAILKIVKANKTNYGIYHFSGGGTTSWFEFACNILKFARSLGLVSKETAIKPLTTQEYPTKAKRPAWSVLDKSKIVTEFGIDLRSWETSLFDFLQLVKETEST